MRTVFLCLALLVGSAANAQVSSRSSLGEWQKVSADVGLKYRQSIFAELDSPRGETLSHECVNGGAIWVAQVGIGLKPKTLSAHLSDRAVYVNPQRSAIKFQNDMLFSLSGGVEEYVVTLGPNRQSIKRIERSEGRVVTSMVNTETDLMKPPVFVEATTIQLTYSWHCGT